MSTEQPFTPHVFDGQERRVGLGYIGHQAVAVLDRNDDGSLLVGFYASVEARASAEVTALSADPSAPTVADAVPPTVGGFEQEPAAPHTAERAHTPAAGSVSEQTIVNAEERAESGRRGGVAERRLNKDPYGGGNRRIGTADRRIATGLVTPLTIVGEPVASLPSQPALPEPVIVSPVAVDTKPGTVI